MASRTDGQGDALAFLCEAAGLLYDPDASAAACAAADLDIVLR